MTEKEMNDLRKKKLKEYKKQLKSEIFDLDKELVYNENGEALIECKLMKAENIFNKYDLAKDRTITDEFEKYLLDEVEIVPPTENIAIKMYVDETFTEENEKQVKKAIKNHFSFKITSDKVKMKTNNIWAGVFFIFGVIFTILSSFINKWFSNSFIPVYEICLITIWFFFWEGNSMAFFDRSDLKEHCYNMLRLYKADITFERVQTIVQPQTSTEIKK